MLEKNYRTLCAEEGRVSFFDFSSFPYTRFLLSLICHFSIRRSRIDGGDIEYTILTLHSRFSKPPSPFPQSLPPSRFDANKPRTQLMTQIVPDEFEIKAKVEEILTESTHSDSRAAKMSIDDILQ